MPGRKPLALDCAAMHLCFCPCCPCRLPSWCGFLQGGQSQWHRCSFRALHRAWQRQLHSTAIQCSALCMAGELATISCPGCQGQAQLTVAAQPVAHAVLTAAGASPNALHSRGSGCQRVQPATCCVGAWP